MNKVYNLTTKKERHCHKPMLCGAWGCAIASVLAFLKQGSSLQQCLIAGVVETAAIYAKMAHNAEIAAVYSWQQLNVSKPCLRTP